MSTQCCAVLLTYLNLVLSTGACVTRTVCGITPRQQPEPHVAICPHTLARHGPCQPLHPSPVPSYGSQHPPRGSGDLASPARYPWGPIACCGRGRGQCGVTTSWSVGADTAVRTGQYGTGNRLADARHSDKQHRYKCLKICAYKYQLMEFNKFQ